MVPLSGKGIERLMREVEDWKNWLQERTTVFLDRVAQEGMEVTSAKFSQAVYDGTNDVVVSAEYRGEKQGRLWQSVKRFYLSSSAQA